MQKRHLVVLIGVLCFVASFFAVGAEAKSGVRVKHVPKSKLTYYSKAYGNFGYNAKLNRWECIECTNASYDSLKGKTPVILEPSRIGKQKAWAYLEAGNMMADPCDESYIIITDQSYAIVISTDCTGDGFGRYAKSFTLPKGVHAIRAKEQAGWDKIE